MINWLFSRLQRPERGWDPVPDAYAREYAERQWLGDTAELTDRIEAETLPLAGREVLDLGAGPGHFTRAFAERGANVTWFDVSRNYQAFARERLADLNGGSGTVAWELGYLEEAARLGRTFDLVFSKICWYYCMDDRRFARLVHGLVRPGGWAYLITPYLESPEQQIGTLHRLRGRINDRLGIKVGHPYPTRDLIERVWRGLAVQEFSIETSPRNVTIRFRR